MRVRWFGVAFAFFQIFMGTDPACPAGTAIPVDCEPFYLRPTGYGIATVVLVVNFILMLWLRGNHTEKELSRAGMAMFLFDHLFMISFTWLYSFTETTDIWIILYIAPLEGALRYQMRGALGSNAILFAAEIARDLWRQETWGFEFELIPGTSFRLGIMLIIALVAGMMARSLDRERQEVERQALNASDLADREGQARHELEAFHRATLAGVSTGDFQEAMQRMITTIGERLEFESLAMGVLEQTNGEPRLRVVAGYRYPKETIGRTIGLDQGVCGPVVRDRTPIVVNDVARYPNYLDFAPWAHSEMAVPLIFGDRVVGVLNVESREKDSFADEDLAKLSRLAIPVALVVENARILATEQETVKRLRELDTMKSDFISITSHELRTPLTAIRGFIQTIMRPDVKLSEEERNSYLEVIDRQSRRLQTLVEDLLFISQLEAGAIESKRTTLDLYEVAREVVREDFSNEIARIQIGRPEESFTFVSDVEGLRRVISSLLDNAVKYSPPSSEIALSMGQSMDGVWFSVSDEGVGIPEEEVDKVFERFHQVGGSMKRKHRGFGLGLYISRKIVESLGGSISASSSKGEGSTFTVSIPKERVAAVAS